MRIPFIDGTPEDEMLCNKGTAKMKKLFLIFLMLIGTSEVFANTWGPGTGHTITNIRAYPDGSLVFQFTPNLDAGCQYNDHSLTPVTSPAYKLLSSLVVTAYTTQKKVQIIYNGCAVNVNVTGIIVL